MWVVINSISYRIVGKQINLNEEKKLIVGRIQKLLLIYSQHNIISIRTMSYAKSNINQASYSIFYIYCNRIIRYLKIGVLLHFMGLAGLIVFWVMGGLAMDMLGQNRIVLFIFFGYIAVYAFTLPFFAEMDVRSRYQNYKAAKDMLHIYGFQKRIVKPFLRSRCQRDALLVAAKDLGCEIKLVNFYYKAGYRWYHILPDYIYKNPGVFFTKQYWSTTLFVRKYTMKYFLW